MFVGTVMRHANKKKMPIQSATDLNYKISTRLQISRVQILSEGSTYHVLPIFEKYPPNNVPGIVPWMIWVYSAEAQTGR